MSTSNRQHDRDASSSATGAAYARRDSAGDAENWWGEDEDGTPEQTGHDPQEFEYSSEKASWLAHDYLKQTARILCATTLFETPCLPGGETQQLFAFLDDGSENLEHNELAVHHENTQMELSEPTDYKPAFKPPAMESRVGHRQAMTRSRINTEHGYMGGLYISDQSTEQFVAAVDGLIDWWAAVKDLRESKVNALRDRARQQKAAGDQRDIEIVEGLLEDVMMDSILEGDE